MSRATKSNRPWFRMDAAILDHPKVAMVSDTAVVAFVGLIAYSAREKTDGEVPLRWAERIRGEQPLAELVEVGLLETPTDTHIQIHDYLDWQTPRVVSDRRAEAGSKGGQASKEEPDG